MKAITGLYHMMAAMSNPLDMYHNWDDRKADIHGVSSKTEEERKTKKGLSKFVIEGKEYWALNKKSATKKHFKFLKTKQS